MSNPWESWIPGALSSNQVMELRDQDFLQIPDFEDSPASSRIDSSSFDLSLSDEAYELKSGSVKPYGKRYLHFTRQAGLLQPFEPDDEGIFSLQAKHTYLFRLNENIVRLRDGDIFGQATAKSTVGRVDVLARLIVDGMNSYEEFSPDRIDSGAMFLEITPITFNVRVKANACLTQLRLFKGPPHASELTGKYISRTILTEPADDELGHADEMTLSLDLTPVDVSGMTASAFATLGSEYTEGAYIDLWKQGGLEAERFWERISSNEHRRLVIDPGKFYIMRSAELIRVPKGIAVYCRAIDETIGEMRIHYAGFAHPFFGDRDDAPGTPLIFEVRGHDVQVNLHHRETMARLVFYRMSEDATGSPVRTNSYNKQTLKLSKYFADWIDT